MSNVTKRFKASNGAVYEIGAYAGNVSLKNGRDAERVLSNLPDTWDGISSDLPIDEGTATSITSAAQLIGFLSDGKTYKGVTVSLCTDIDLDGKTFTSKGNFSGIFNGMGHTVKNLSQALFTQNSGMIADLRFAGENARIATINAGTISNCTCENTDSSGRIVNTNSGASKILDCIMNSGNLAGSESSGIGRNVFVGEFSGTQDAKCKIMLGMSPKLVMVFARNQVYPFVKTANSGNNQYASIGLSTNSFTFVPPATATYAYIVIA